MIEGWHKRLIGVALLLPLVLACGIFGDAPPPTNTAAHSLGSVDQPGIIPTPVTTVKAATSTPEEPPTATASPTTQPSPSPPPTEEAGQPAAPSVLHDLSIETEDILLFPVPAVYDGDLVTIHISPNIPRGLAPNDVQVRVLLDGEDLLTGTINYVKLSGDVVGLYQWVWDTAGQQGPHTITIELDPQDRLQINDENAENNVASLDLIVQPRDLLPASQADARWIEAETNCCVLHVVSGTAAYRDIEQLKTQVDDAFEQAAATLAAPLSDVPYDIYLIDRVIGQGGYAMEDMVVSYLDRDYAGGELDELLVHEAVHLIDRSFAPDRVTFLAEGMAVWVAGGHYQQQNLGQRMAALIELGEYVPIDQIIENFNVTQHEISYLESASLVEYLVNTFGWQRVRDFYSNTSADDGPTLLDAVNANLVASFGQTLEQIELAWLEYVASLPRDLTADEDLLTTIRFYDVMRRYQSLHDPTAYYLYAWLPDPAEAAKRQATADFSRHPETDTNIVLEAMLLTANTELWQGNYDRVNGLLDSVSRVLNHDGLFLDPLAKSYLSIVQAVAEEGYEVQRIELDGDRATVTATRPNRMNTGQLMLRLNRDRTWSLSP